MCMKKLKKIYASGKMRYSKSIVQDGNKWSYCKNQEINKMWVDQILNTSQDQWKPGNVKNFLPRQKELVRIKNKAIC